MLTVKDVALLTHMSRVTLYRLVRAGNFPVPVAISGRSIRWTEDDIAVWQDNLRRKQYGPCATD
jgi:predicted DNA-binding transcriptional regulator AlpA